MKTTLANLLNASLLSAALLNLVSVAPAPLQAQEDRRYHDARHNDEHQWNDREDRAYRMWLKEKHRSYRDFAKLKENERQSYWDWRHEHSDAVLKIDIR